MSGSRKSQYAQGLDLPWLPFATTPERFARMVDRLILACAILLFWVLALVWIQIFPAWWQAVLLTIALVVALRLLYWLTFNFALGVTPGMALTQMLAHPDTRPPAAPID